MSSYLIKNGNIVNEGVIKNGDILIQDGKIECIADTIEATAAMQIIDATGKYVIME